MSADEARRDALWKMYQEHCTHMRHHENQRSTVAASLVAIASALVGVAAFDRTLSLSDLPLFGLVIALGAFGAVFSAKQYERSAMHMERARACRNAIDADLEGRPLQSLKDAADHRHRLEFPRLTRLAIHTFWLLLYLFITATGLLLAVLATAMQG